MKPATEKFNKSYIEVVKVLEKRFSDMKLDKECLSHLQNLLLISLKTSLLKVNLA